MKYLKESLFLLLACALTGCTPVVLMLMGMHTPRVESQSSIYKAAHKHGIDTVNYFYVVDSASFKRSISGAFPKIYFYNSNGDLILSNDCFELLKKYTDSLYNGAEFNVIKNKALNEELKNARKFNGENVSYESSQTEFTVVYYWADWMGKVNRDKLGWLENKAKTDQRKRLNVIKVNADMQKSWKWSKKKYKKLFNAKS